MKFIIIILIITSSLISYSQKDISYISNINSKTLFDTTSNTYNNDLIFSLFRNIMLNLILSNDTSNYSKYFINKYPVLPIYVYNINDTSLNNLRDNGKIIFKNKNIYHFTSFNYKYLYSNICYFDYDKLIIFKALDCDCNGNNYDDVIQFLHKKGYDNNKIRNIILKIKNYKENTVFWKTDNYSSIKCNYNFDYFQHSSTPAHK